MKLTAKKILVMHYQGIGGTVLIVPFLRNLREAYPAAQIDLMLEPLSGQVLEGCPYVDGAAPFPLSAPSDRGKLAGALHSLKLIKNERYDAVFVLDHSLSSAVLVRAARVPRRIGFATGGRGLFLTDPVPYRYDRHEVELFLDCLRILGIPIRSTALELWPAPESESRVMTFLSNAGWKASDLKIVIHAAADLPAGQWPLERFAAVMKALKNKFKARFIYTGTKGDSALYEELERRGPFYGLNLCGVTSIRENISVYRAADLFFGVESGALHVAAAAGIPVVALFGPTDERKWGPWGEGHIVLTGRLTCRPCSTHTCRDNECMKQISADEEIEAVEKKIREIYPKVLYH